MLPWRLHVLRLRAATLTTWLVAGFIFSTLLMAVGPLLAGLHTYTVRSGSMTPAIRTGDVVLSRSIDPAAARVGQIVTFSDPAGTDALITHRVRAVRRDGAKYAFVTRGDANNTSERWMVPADGTIGKVVWRVPMLGYAVSPMDSRGGQIALIAIPCLLLLALGLRRIWSGTDEEERPAA